MRLKVLIAGLSWGILLALGMGQALAGNIQVTPLGSHDGELCQMDRALVFEDPDGTRVLYDAGRTVRGPEDERLGKIDAVLLSHVHADHLGDRHQDEANDGECGSPNFLIPVTPNSNTVNIMLSKKAKLVVGSEMGKFFATKAQRLGGNPGDVLLVRHGGSRRVGGVKITTVPAVHSNGLSPIFLHGTHAHALAENGLNAYVGPPTGYVLTFSNGLSVYLSGDTGVTAEQETLVRRLYGVKLMVINIGDIFTTGPTEAAWVANELVKPNAVIASHTMEASTKDGKVLPGSRLEVFIKATKAPVHIPLSGRMMTFNGQGRCVSGC